MSLERRVEALEQLTKFHDQQVTRYGEILAREFPYENNHLTRWKKIINFVVENKALLLLVAIPLLKAIVDILNVILKVLHKISQIPGGI